ncbi:MAG: CNP1-like family protein [Candidatus Thiodiazotropha sp.]
MKALYTLILSLGLVAASHAYDPLETDEKIEYTPTDDAWQEAQVTVPEHFDPDDLQSFTLKGSNDRFEYAIERNSLHTDDDGVSRFLVVIRSSQGAVNSSYEGLRCGYREYKVYAYGSGKGLTPLPGSEWQSIPKASSDYRAILYEDLICNLLTGQANPPDAVFQAMRSNQPVTTPFIHSGRE